jgi:hypothetical protein
MIASHHPRLLKTTHLTAPYVDEMVAIWLTNYPDADPAIYIEAEDGEALATATVNMAAYGIHPEEGNVLIKDYAEGEGMVDALIAAGVIGKPVREHSGGFAIAQECPLRRPLTIPEI